MSEERKWTEAQTQAFTSLDGTILVSAAAGSGKTAVLVKRIIERITRKNNPSSIDRLLVVTFTKAAAAEMKKRLSDELTKLIIQNPNESHLKRQKMYLPEAQICTMDSFCSKLVKENYETIGISPDFTMLSDSDHSIILNETADEILNEIYENPNEDDKKLLELFTNQKNDDTLRTLLVKMYNLSMADANPQKWIDDAFSPYFDLSPVEESECGKYIISVLREQIEFILEKIDRTILDSQGYPKLETAITGDLKAPEYELREILNIIDNNTNWNDIRDRLNLISFGTFTRFSEEEKDAQYFDIKSRRDLIKKDIESLKNILICTSEDYESDAEYFRPIMSSLKNRVKRFIERLYEVKAENNSYYFSDILQFSLSLLYNKAEDGIASTTPLAKELQEEFDEILIDEFQDTNQAQVSLFYAISKNAQNEFIVGDVKQSIYAFRQACPEIFVSLLAPKPYFDGSNYPAKISLDANFRSRKGVVDGVNFFFDMLMVPSLGGLDYKKTERLTFGATDFDEHEVADTEVHIVESFSPRSNNLEEESRYIGNVIKKMINDKVTVGKGEEKRPVQYRDICILLRSAKNKANVVAGELIRMGIPVHYKKEGGFFDNAEIMTVISMLRIIDNPIQDVPLLSVLLSPLTSFTEDDIARLRAKHKKCSLYSMLKQSEETENKAKEFLELIDYFRTLSVTLSVADLIRRIYEVTAYDCVVSAMDGGDRRVLNLQKLTSYAEGYTSNGNFGLTGFIRYIDKLQKNGTDLEGAETVSENDNVVKIMTIHKSKGLEFPVVILANMSAAFRGESKEKLPVNKTLGAGALRFVPEENREIKTQFYSSVVAKNEDEGTAENLRLLYVAMTRAKEKLLIVGSAYEPEKRVKDLFYKYNVSESNIKVAIKKMNNFFDWVLYTMIYHPSFSKFPFVKELCGRTEYSTDSNIGISYCEKFYDTDSEIENSFTEFSPNENIVNEIKEKVAFVYPYDLLAGVEIKYTASSMDNSFSNEFFASENPRFLSKGKITPAQKGTLIHKFMEVCDLENASKNLDEEIERAVKCGALTEDEVKVIEKGKLTKFFNSNVYNRILNADKYLREKEFAMSVPLNEIKPELNITNDEFAVVQGVIDGLIITGEQAEIIDFKTDRVKSAEELCERYKSQMAIYKKAAAECFGAKNVKVTLYSFELSQEISVKFEKNT